MDLNEKIKRLLKTPKVKRYLDKSIRIASYKTKTRIDDSDSYQIKLISCWKAILCFKPNKNSKFITYLCKVAYTQTLKFLKKNKPFKYSIRNNDRAYIQNNSEFEVLECLKQPHYEIFKLFFIDKFNKKQIAQKLCISQFKVNNLINEGKKIIEKNYLS